MNCTVIKRPVRKTDMGNYALFPVYRNDHTEVGKLTTDRTYRARVWRPRNLKYHNLFFALCALVVDNSEKWQTVEQFRQAFLIFIGYVQIIPGLDGNPVAVPDSMKFDRLDEDQFESEIMARFWPVVAKELDLDEGELRADYQRILSEGGGW